jgi:hypothetical protein
MQILAAVLLATLLGFPAAQAATQRAKATHKPVAKAHAKTPKPAGKSTARKTTARPKTIASKGKGRRATVPVRSKRGKKSGRVQRASVPKVVHNPSQGNPTSTRYMEIQEALASRGYLKTTPSGVWDQDSVAAMKSFQADQKLATTGKLTSLSLIALGLGPKPAAESDSPPH